MICGFMNSSLCEMHLAAGRYPARFMPPRDGLSDAGHWKIRIMLYNKNCVCQGVAIKISELAAPRQTHESVLGWGQVSLTVENVPNIGVGSMLPIPLPLSSNG